MPVIRISRGNFDVERFAAIQQKLTDSNATLATALWSLPGLIHYYAGIDPVSNSMTNTSIWEDLDAARQMESLDPMIRLANEFAEMGVRFERPIVNFTGLWELHPKDDK